MESNLDAARAYYGALEDRDAAALLEILHPDAELRLTDGLPDGLGGSYGGAMAALGALGRVAEVFDVVARPETLLDAKGDRVVVLGRYVGSARATGRPLDAAFVHVLEFREGRVAWHTQVTDSSRWANALRCVGGMRPPTARAKEAALNIDSWIERYGRAWREKDDEAVGALFAEGATYASHPLQLPDCGREGIRAYWRRATADQEDLDLRFGEPVVSEDGRRAAVEWWATMRDGGWAARQGAGEDRLTLPGCLVLRFDADGLCEELREYWNVAFGPPARPPEGWGG